MALSGTSLTQSISDDLSRRILLGDFRSGSRLPTIRQLADEYQTSYFTVQTALKPLAEQGLVEQRRRTGTVVRHNINVLTCAGIYCAGTMMDEREYAFYRELSRQLQIQLAAQNVRTRIYLDVRPVEEQVTVPAELVAMIEKCEIQALFSNLSNSYIAPRLAELPVAFSSANNRTSKNGVMFDSEQMMRLALTRLAECGCRSVGLISAMELPDEAHPQSLRFYETFIAASCDLGMKIRDAWVRMPPPEGVTQHERFGYQEFGMLWRQGSRPDGLFVFPDTSARGVMTAVLELGVRVPEDLKMIFHHNSGVDWVCPLGVDWMESDVALWAAEMIKQVRRQKAGKPVENVLLEYALKIAGKTE